MPAGSVSGSAAARYHATSTRWPRSCGPSRRHCRRGQWSTSGARFQVHLGLTSRRCGAETDQHLALVLANEITGDAAVLDRPAAGVLVSAGGGGADGAGGGGEGIGGDLPGLAIRDV